MPDYSVRKIDAKIIGPRFASILTKLNDVYKQETYLYKLSFIQSKQIDGLDYVSIKSLKLDKVTKMNNLITVRYKTVLEPNKLNIKNAELTFDIIDGVSNDNSVNELLCNICRYIKE